MSVGDWFLDIISTVTKSGVYKMEKELDDLDRSKKQTFQYKIFEEKTFWRWWASLSSLGVTIVSTKSFVSRELALVDMKNVFTTFGMTIK